MKSKVKIDEIKELSVNELKLKEKDLRKDLLNLKLEKASHQLKNPLSLRVAKRDIARVLTVIRKKEEK